MDSRVERLAVYLQRSSFVVGSVADYEAAGLVVIDTTDEATRVMLRTALEHAVRPFLAHDPAKPEVFWPQMVSAVLAALNGGA
jgi:hypothetical protein